MPRRTPRGRGSVFPDKARDRWVAQIDIDGRRYRRVRATRAAAMDALDELRGATRRGLDPGVKPALDDYLREWLGTLRVREITRQGYRSKLERHVIPRLGRVRLDRLRPLALDRLLVDLERDGLGLRSVAHVRAILRNALGRAERIGLIERNPAALTEAVPVPNRERRVLTQDEARTLVEALQGHRLEAAFVLSMTLGLRQSETLGLRWSDVGADSLHVRQTLHWTAAQGYHVTEPKTPRSRRDVPLPDSLAALLELRRREQRAEYLASGARPTHNLVFTRHDGSPLLGTNVTRELQRVLVAVGLPRVTYHDLRHTAASMLATRGFTLREVQAILGHASMSTTANVYTHVDEGDVARRLRGIAW